MNKSQRILQDKYKTILGESFFLNKNDRTGGRFEYKGYIYKPEEDREEDNTKIFQFVITPDGKLEHINWSSYSYMTREDFQLWVDIGAPLDYNLWDRAGLNKYVEWKRSVDAKLNKNNPGIPPTF